MKYVSLSTQWYRLVLTPYKEYWVWIEGFFSAWVVCCLVVFPLPILLSLICHFPSFFCTLHFHLLLVSDCLLLVNFCIHWYRNLKYNYMKKNPWVVVKIMNMPLSVHIIIQSYWQKSNCCPLLNISNRWCISWCMSAVFAWRKGSFSTLVVRTFSFAEILSWYVGCAQSVVHCALEGMDGPWLFTQMLCFPLCSAMS